MIAPMATEIDNYRRMFRDLYGQVDEVLDGMDTEALLFKPFETSPWKGPSGSVGWILPRGVLNGLPDAPGRVRRREDRLGWRRRRPGR